MAGCDQPAVAEMPAYGVELGAVVTAGTVAAVPRVDAYAGLGMVSGIAPAGRRRLVAALLFTYLAVVAFGVFGPAPDDQIQRAGDSARRVAGEIGAVIPGGRKEPPEGASGDRLFGSVRTEAAANVALFIPLGVLFPVLFRRWRWWTVPVGMATSVIIEGIQLVFLSWRSPSLADVAWNSLGALIGFALWLVRPRRRRPGCTTR